MTGYKLPSPLSKQEVYELLEKIKQGDGKAKDKLAEHNIRLVLYEVMSRFKTVEYDKKDLVSIGIVGLMKAIETFDTSKKVEFTTYTTRCIDNEILMFLRQLKKDEKVDSLDKVIYHDKEGNELKIEDTISDGIDIIEEYTDNETQHIIRQIVDNLPKRDRKIIRLYFGFYNGKTYSQREIAERLSISRSHVSQIITKNVKQIGSILEEVGIVELRKKTIPKEKSKHNKKGTMKMPRKTKTIYEYFSSYTKEQVNAMLEKLTEEDKALITLRFGEDLDNPAPNKLSGEEYKKFYNSLVKKMEKLLADPNRVIRTRRTKVEEKQNVENTSISASNESMSKEDYVKILELLRTPAFTAMMSTYSPKEVVIASLKLGYIDGKVFSTSAISNFLDIEENEVLEATTKMLLAYKEKVNQIIDSVMQFTKVETKPTISVLNKSLNGNKNN